MAITDTGNTDPPELLTDQEIACVIAKIALDASSIETLCIEALGHMSTDPEDWKNSISICEDLMLTIMRNALRIRWIADRYSDARGGSIED